MSGSNADCRHNVRPDLVRDARAEGSHGPVMTEGADPSSWTASELALWEDARAGSQFYEQLVRRYEPLAISCARRFVGRGETYEELYQVAMIGLFQAIRRFDHRRGVAFSTFAIPTILGTLKRHFRDLTWDSTVSRRMKDRFLEVRLATNELESRKGTAPSIEELASYLRRDVSDIIEALDAGDARRGAHLSSDALDAALRLSDVALRPESEIVVRQVIRSVLATVSPRDRRIFFLRLYAEYTQTEIASDAGITQAQVSRVLTSLIDRVGTALLEHDPRLLHRE